MNRISTLLEKKKSSENKELPEKLLKNYTKLPKIQIAVLDDIPLGLMLTL